MPAGKTSHGKAGLCGPPLRTTPLPSSSRVIRIAVALTRSGCWLLPMRRSTIVKFRAEAANRGRVHHPIHGAEMISALPTAIEPTRRMVRTRSLASTTRRRSSSVGHSQEPSLMCSTSTARVPILESVMRETTYVPGGRRHGNQGPESADVATSRIADGLRVGGRL